MYIRKTDDRKGMFVPMNPLEGGRDGGHIVAYCVSPESGGIFPVIDSVNGLVGGNECMGSFDGVAFARIFRDRTGACWLVSPKMDGFDSGRIKVDFSADGNSVRIGRHDVPLFFWNNAKKQCLFEMRVPDGRKFGEVGGGLGFLPLAEVESLYRDISRMPSCV